MNKTDDSSEQPAGLPDFSLDGRLAMVTGASSGLGKRFARLLVLAGARVVLAARRVQALEALAGELRQIRADSARAVALDVTDANSVRSAFDACADMGTIDVLLNNSGVAVTSSVVDTSEEDWARVLDTNLSGAWRVAREAARRMVEAGTGGSIVNTASITCDRPARGLGAYAASKAGVAHLTRVMALELARHDIRVNAIAPGYVLTEINRAFFESEAGAAMIRTIPQRRIGQPEDLDGVVLLLCSAASRFMTGSVVTIDGGHSHAGLA